MSRITTTFDSQDSQIQQSLMLMNQRYEKLIEKQHKLAEEAKQGGKGAVRAAEQNEKAIYNLQLQILKLQGQQAKRRQQEQAEHSAAMQRLKEEEAAMQEAERKRQEGIKQSGNLFRNTMQEGIGLLKSTLLQYASVAGAVHLVTSAYRDWKSEMKQLAESSERFNKANIKGLAQSRGGLENAPALMEQQRTHPTATREQMAAIQQGLSEAAPTMSQRRLMDISQELGRTTPLFPSPEDLKQFAQAAGELADTLPDFKPKDIADLTLSLQRQGGLKPEQISDKGFQRATKVLRDTGALNPLQALSIGAEAIDANLDPKSIEKLASKLTEKVKPPQIPAGRAMTADEKAFRAYALEKDTSTRLRMLEEGGPALQQKVLGDKLANQFRQIDFGKAERRAAMVGRDVAGDYVGERLRLLQQTPEGTEQLQAQKREAQHDKAKEIREQQARRDEAAYAKLEQMLDEDKMGLLTRGLTKSSFYVSEFLNNLSGREEPGLEALKSTTGFGPAYQDPRVKKFVQEQMALKNQQRARRGEPEFKQLPGESPQARDAETILDWLRHMFIGTTPPVKPPVIEEQQPELPARPKLEIPEPPRRMNRGPAPLGPSAKQLQDAFKQQASDRIANDPRFNTKLGPEEEKAFQTWRDKNAPGVSGYDFDLRGAFKAGATPDEAGLRTFAKPNNPQFSTESKYAPFMPEAAGRFEGEKYIPGPGVQYDRQGRQERPAERPVFSKPYMQPAIGDQSSIQLPPVELIPPQIPRQVQLPDVELLPPKIRLPSLADMAGREPMEQKFRMPEAAPGIAQQLAEAIESSRAANQTADFSPLTDVLNKMLNLQTEANAVAVATQRGIEALGDKRLPPGISPAASVQDRNRHFEVG